MALSMRNPNLAGLRRPAVGLQRRTVVVKAQQQEQPLLQKIAMPALLAASLIAAPLVMPEDAMAARYRLAYAAVCCFCTSCCSLTSALPFLFCSSGGRVGGSAGFSRSRAAPA